MFWPVALAFVPRQGVDPDRRHGLVIGSPSTTSKCASIRTALALGSRPGRIATSPPSLGWSGAVNKWISGSPNPAALRCAAILSAARVQLPDESVVLVSTSSLYKARNAT